MSKNLSRILTVFKVARILANIIFILCIVGGAGCILGLVMLPLASGLLESDLLLMQEFNLPSAYIACLAGAVACAGEAVFAFFAERYFKNVLSAGTPFTFDGSKECFRLGITSIIISASTSVLAGIIAFAIILFTASTNLNADVNMSISLTTGLFFLFLSLIFKHGAELQTALAEKAQEEAQRVAREEAQRAAQEEAQKKETQVLQQEEQKAESEPDAQ